MQSPTAPPHPVAGGEEDEGPTSVIRAARRALECRDALAFDRLFAGADAALGRTIALNHRKGSRMLQWR